DLESLHQRQHLEHFVHGPEAAVHEDEAVRVLHEHHLADEEVFELDQTAAVRVGLLLHGQVDGELDAFAAALGRAVVAGLHDARAAAGYDPVTRLRQLFRQQDGGLVQLVIGVRARAAEDGNAAPDLAECVKTLNKLGHDPEHLPGVPETLNDLRFTHQNTFI